MATDLGRGIAALGVGIAVAVAVYVTKDVNALWGLCVLIFVF